MCVRNAKSCSQCRLVFPMPLSQSLGRRILCRWLRLGRYKPEILTDILCDNLFCLRRTEEGYRLCLDTNEPCWCCLRIGQEGLCYNVITQVLCEKCFFASHPPTLQYPFPQHCRRPDRPQRDFRYTQLYTLEDD